ncbi:hypothetical protein LMG19087_03076 [Ralstonia wenshanensis]|uniref:Membrane protein involved in colicin uptake n=2 Tax=Burkholderiaceae TaxID=119060 RepID=A0AAD2EUS8_9RALS|nr:hypothetical protein LMG18091_04022 [Ralstonia wenshanensis]CAJ0817361.1 hypothetical protein LMG19087_03076 [Ralstonia wenshanensis]
MESRAFCHNANPVPELKSVAARRLPHRRGDKMRVMPTLLFSARRRAAARRASRLVLPASMLSVALLAAPAWSQSSPASAPAAAVPATQPDFGAEHDRITSAKAWAEYRYAQAERACYDKFLVTRCIDKAKDVRRTELHTIRERELALDEAERADRAARRDQERAIREAQYNAERPQREAAEQKNRTDFANKQEQQRLNEAQRQAEAPQRAANAQAAAKKQADYDARLKAAQEQGAANAAKRAENVKQFQEKQQDAAKRQKELEERREQSKHRKEQNQNNTSPLGF